MIFTSLPVSLLLFPLSLWLVRSVDAAASLTPPAESISTSGSVELSISFTPLSSASSSGSSASESGSTSLSATATSSAQFPSLSGLSDCANQCFGLAISQDGCDSIIDVNCYCANPGRFTSGLVACISTQCPGDLSSAESISEQFCAVASQSTSLSFPTPPPSTSFSDPFTSSTSASVPLSRNSSSATSPSSTSTSSASASSFGSGQGNGAGFVHAAGITGLLGLVASLMGFVLVGDHPASTTELCL
ncbi:hypothetical protein OH77DRAFT_1447418 [Trametes cingulata]|nr:hypothetical protein OH77DRAFT_1447418 [Trametes cingulata]